MSKEVYILHNESREMMVGVFSCYENAVNAMFCAMEGWAIDSVVPDVVVSTYSFISTSTGEVMEMSIERATMDDPFFLPHKKED